MKGDKTTIIHDEPLNSRFRITWKNSDDGKFNAKRFKYKKKGRDVVLEEVIKYCNEQFARNYKCNL